MNRKTSPEWRLWKSLLLIHIAGYEAFFIASLANFNSVWYAAQNNFIILLFWTAILLLHVGMHYYHLGRSGLGTLERQAYRDGFADAVRQLANRQDGIDRRALNDESELLEIVEKPKRDRL